MVKLGVIGLGTIFPIQQEALTKLSAEYKIVGVCDKQREKWKNCSNQTGEIRFFESSTELLSISEIDSVLIATPPGTHYRLALACINAGKNVLLEKPAVLSMEELEHLYWCADKKKVILHIAYHASFALDINWYQKHPYGKITSVVCGFYDPYMKDNQILPGKELLGGSFLDSGVNALSVCARLVDVKQMESVNHDTRKSKGIVYESVTNYQSPEAEIVIKTGWNQGKNEKTTLLGFAESEDKILLDHSNQRVMLQNSQGEKELYKEDENPRLVNHYAGVFKDFGKVIKSNVSNREISIEIHRLLLGNGD